MSIKEGVKMDTQPKAKLRSARINDYTSFRAGQSSNGGCYGFWTDYTYIGNGYEVTHGTTADFEYCQYCGSFGSCNCDEPSIVDEKEVWKEIEAAQKDSSPKIYAEYGLFENHEEWIEKLRRRVRDALNKTADEAQIINVKVDFDK